MFRGVNTLQNFRSAHDSIHDQFDFDRQHNNHDIFEQSRSSATKEWRRLAV